MAALSTISSRSLASTARDMVFIPSVPVTTGREKHYRVVYFRPVAMQTDKRRIAFVEEANIVGLSVISSEDLPEHATLVNCKAKPWSRLIETHVRDYCIAKCRAQKGWRLVAELKAKHLMHYHRRSLVPVIAVLLERPKPETSRQSIFGSICSKFRRRTLGEDRGNGSNSPDGDERWPLLTRASSL